MVHFDQVLDMVGRDQCDVDFTPPPWPLMLAMGLCMCGQSRLLIVNHFQHVIKMYQALPLLS